ncbi:MAG: DNA mismatch repair endonuclease MutL [Lachnospiraceae bacterium]|nr:DNA mismatch repair endonuclease MutL [Lachnospiraceae bacterium]
MNIKVLDEKTIDKIAAGEVIERPQSVVKELVENSLDAGADSIVIEIENGGVDLIKITDNGRGIDRNEVRAAFLPHATSKLKSIDDLVNLKTLGFRGEALSSIAAVARVELLTKTREQDSGVRYLIEGGEEKSIEDAGTINGTVFIVRDLFFHAPVRKKFLKSPATEAGYVMSLVEELALSNTRVAFKLIINGQPRLMTRGNGDLAETIYRVYGREIADSLLTVESRSDSYDLTGFIAKPMIARSNRNMESYFVNGRFVRDQVISKGIEDGYTGFLMMRKFPFTVLSLEVIPGLLDVNVHPRKNEVRFSDPQSVYEFVSKAVRSTLSGKEFINRMEFGSSNVMIFQGIHREKEDSKNSLNGSLSQKTASEAQKVEKCENNESLYTVNRPSEFQSSDSQGTLGRASDKQESMVREVPPYRIAPVSQSADSSGVDTEKIKPEQMDLFEERILSKKAAAEYKVMGQIFGTYIIIEYKDKMLLLDQHAAHEKILFERFMKKFRERVIEKQLLMPPIIFRADGKRAGALEKYDKELSELGFEIERLGGRDYAVRSVPADLFGLDEAEAFESMLDSLSENPLKGLRKSGKESRTLSDNSEGANKDSSDFDETETNYYRIATMACKAAVKANMKLGIREMEAMVGELLTLNDPYSCPHGRPTIIEMTKRDLERKFKRIV